jgi:hypothetical protein
MRSCTETRPDFVIAVAILRVPQGIPGGLAKSKISHQWIHSLAALAAKPFLTTSLQAQENNPTVL